MILSASSAYGSLVYIQEVDLGGTGLGAVPTILTQQDKGGNGGDATGAGFSSGCVAPGTSGDITGSAACVPGVGLTGGEEKNGASQTLTRSFSDPGIVALGITSLAKLGIIYNSSNQGNNEVVTLNQLVLGLYNGSDLVFAATLDAPQTLTGVQGTGQSGFLFALDQTQLDLANFLTAGLDFGSLRIGLGANVSNDEAGQETFFVGAYNRPTNEPPEVPEPATCGLVGGALLSAGLLRAKFRKS